MKSTIQSLDVSYLVHETEDLEKVNSAVAKFIGSEVSPEIEVMAGHFGNSITKGSVHLHGAEATQSFQGIVQRLPPALKTDLVAKIGIYVDEHSSLFLRFDKQRLVQGELAAGSKDAIRVKVKPRAFLMKGRANEFFANLLTGS